MFRNEKNQISGFDPKNFTNVFPGTATEYLDWKVQQLWFYQVYPDGAIITSEPHADDFKTADTWVATTKIYLSKEDRANDLPVIVRSARRGPKDNQETEDVVDTYTLSIIASISSALTALGFAPAIRTNEEREAFQKELLGLPEAPAPVTAEDVKEAGKTLVNAVAGVSKALEEKTAAQQNADTAIEEMASALAEEAMMADETTSAQNVPVSASVENPAPTPHRGRPTKAEVAAKAEAAAKTGEETAKANPSPAPVKTAPAETTITFNSLEEARKVPCTYRNIKGTSIGEIWDNKDNNTTYNSFIKWCQESDRAPAKCPVDVAALKYIEANS